MKVIVCIDDDGHMMFNHRRVSKDRMIIKDISHRFLLENIICKEYSKSLFDDRVKINNDIPNRDDDHYQFIEDDDLSCYHREISEIVIYSFNRRYPGDLQLRFDYSQMKIIDEEEFPGSSHDVITRRVYRR